MAYLCRHASVHERKPLAPDSLFLYRTVIVVRWGRSIRRDEVRRLVQVKDEGEGDDDFPSWGLLLEGPRTL